MHCIGEASKGSRARPLSALATELKASGVVRIDGALSPALVEELREFVDAERVQATADVKAGRCDQKARFADLVLLDKRCDLLLPLHGPPIAALQELLGEGSVLGPLQQEVVGEAGVLQELACLTSEPGSAQQPLHPDTPWTPIPSAYTAFIALRSALFSSSIAFHSACLRSASRASSSRSSPSPPGRAPRATQEPACCSSSYRFQHFWQ